MTHWNSEQNPRRYLANCWPLHTRARLRGFAESAETVNVEFAELTTL